MRLTKYALLASLAIVRLNYLLTARWAYAAGSVHGNKEPFFARRCRSFRRKGGLRLLPGDGSYVVALSYPSAAVVDCVAVATLASGMALAYLTRGRFRRSRPISSTAE